VLVVQSLPFVAAVALAMIEGTRLNEFAYWRRVQTKVATVLSRSAARVESGVSNVLTPDG
jgi:hypothetical protein